jgi:hypothetical protein
MTAFGGGGFVYTPQFTFIFIAIYKKNLTSQVNAGENNGRELKHD